MKKFLLSAGVALMALLPLAAEASMRNKDSTWYAGLGVYATTNSSTNASGATNGALDMDSATLEFGNVMLGYRPMSTFSNWGALRLEAEVSGRGYDFDVNNGAGTFTSNDLIVNSYMGNLLYEFHIFEGLNPIIGAGAGVATGEFGNQDSDSLSLAYQFMGGLTYTPADWPHTDWSIMYSYFVAKDMEFKNGASTTTLDEVNAGAINAGFKYFF